MVRISRLTGRFLLILTPVNNSSGGFQFSISFIIAAVTKAGGDNNGDIRGLRCILRSQVHVRKLKQIARLCPIGS